MENYYQKYKLSSLYFGAYYSGNQYFFPSNTLSELDFNRYNNPYYIDTNKIAAFDSDVNGVTGFSENVAIGAITANAINANASAPPNNPILQIKITNGAMINAIPILSKYCEISEFMKINKNPILPNMIQ